MVRYMCSVSCGLPVKIVRGMVKGPVSVVLFAGHCCGMFLKPAGAHIIVQYCLATAMFCDVFVGVEISRSRFVSFIS